MLPLGVLILPLLLLRLGVHDHVTYHVTCANKRPITATIGDTLIIYLALSKGPGLSPWAFYC